MKRMIVTAALPYANGSIHIGHLVEYVQADIWVRAMRMLGNDATLLCADDTHGTAVMLRAAELGVAPEELIDRMRAEHLADFTAFGIEFDNYHSTHSEDNRLLSEEIYMTLLSKGHIVDKAIEQAFCVTCKIFLPDRFIRGTCPYCGTAEQYGDACEFCSKAYSPRDLQAPHCCRCGSTPSWRATSHAFFKLSDFEDTIRTWLDYGVQAEIRNKMDEWLESGLRDWDITRDAPYFGFEIPGRPGQYFYVWLDAPVGYMASTMDWCRRHGSDFDVLWRSGECEIYHFIGKDIIYFHALFWPAILAGAGFTLPKRLFVHGFLTVGGAKMSKSRGTFIAASTYLKYLDAQYLRYYYATKLNSRIDDIDLNFEDFAYRVNSDLVGKTANIPSRTLTILHRICDGKLGVVDHAGKTLISLILARKGLIANLYEQREFSQITRLAAEMAGDINTYLDDKKPWSLSEDDNEEVRTICTSALNAYKILVTYLSPILPTFARNLEKTLGISAITWHEIVDLVENRQTQPYVRLVNRVDLGRIEIVVNESKASGRS